MTKNKTSNTNKVIFIKDYSSKKMSKLTENTICRVQTLNTEHISVQIMQSEIEFVLCCIFIYNESLKDLLRISNNTMKIRILKNKVSTLEKIYDYLRERLGNKKYASIYLKNYTFEIFLGAIENELKPYLNLETGNFSFSGKKNKDYIEYLEILKTVYDRMNKKYMNLIIEPLKKHKYN